MTVEEINFCPHYHRPSPLFNQAFLSGETFYLVREFLNPQRTVCMNCLGGSVTLGGEKLVLKAGNIRTPQLPAINRDKKSARTLQGADI